MDTPDVPTPLSDAEINSLVDGQLGEADRAALLDRLRFDSAAQARLAEWQLQREQLRGLHREVLDAPLPRELLDAVQRVNASRLKTQQWRQWQRWGGMAAALVLAFGTGWLGRAQWPGAARPGAAQLSALPGFARDAAVAHAVYSPEKRHPVEVAAAEQEHLVQWLSRRTGKPLKLPDLQPQGFALVGGRLLPGEAGARAQFMFQNAEGVRITLYLGALAPDTAHKNGRETAFRFTQEGPVPGFYWVDQGFGYALSGPLTREALMRLAEAVYRQL